MYRMCTSLHGAAKVWYRSSLDRAWHVWRNHVKEIHLAEARNEIYKSRTSHAFTVVSNVISRWRVRRLRDAFSKMMSFSSSTISSKTTKDIKERAMRRFCRSLSIVSSSSRLVRLRRAWGRWVHIVRWCELVWIQNELRTSRLERLESIVQSTTLRVLVRRAWGRWRGLVRWCQYVWMQRRVRSLRAKHVSSILRLVLQNQRRKRLRECMQVWLQSVGLFRNIMDKRIVSSSVKNDRDDDEVPDMDRVELWSRHEAYKRAARENLVELQYALHNASLGIRELAIEASTTKRIRRRRRNEIEHEEKSASPTPLKRLSGMIDSQLAEYDDDDDDDDETEVTMIIDETYDESNDDDVVRKLFD